MAIYEYDSSYFPPAPIVPIRLGTPGQEPEQHLPALLDSGADATIVPLRRIRSLRAPKVDQARLRSPWGDLRSVSVYAISLAVGDVTLQAAWVVGVEDAEDVVILGRDVMNRLTILLDGPAGHVEVR